MNIDSDEFIGLLQQVADLRRERDILRESMRWQPIETAPKHGSRVLIYRPGFNESMCVAWWRMTDGEWQPVHGAGDWRGSTHWLPLPPPPEDTP